METHLTAHGNDIGQPHPDGLHPEPGDVDQGEGLVG